MCDTWLYIASISQLKQLHTPTHSYHFKTDILIIYIDNHDTASDFY